MPHVRVNGVKNTMQFPDDMNINEIREFLRRRFTQQAVDGSQPVELGNRPEVMTGVPESMSQKLARGVSDTLLDTGLISNNQDAYRIGGNVGALAEMAPGVGDLVDADDFGKAAATGDTLGMVTSSLGAIPVLGGLAKKGVNKIGDTLKSKFPDMGIGLRETPDNIILDKVIVPDSQRGQGKGSSFMRELLTEADNSGKPIGLTPSSDFGGNKKRLTDFYKGFGFIENKGKNKDFTISESMIRLPSPPKSSGDKAMSVPDSEVGGESESTVLKDLGMNEGTMWYHGSENEFDEFDFGRSGDNYTPHYGKGAYFASKFNHASEHGKVKNFKLGIKNPMQYDLARVHEARAKGMELSDYAKSLGYDGIIIGDRHNAQMVAFDNSQIKRDTTYD